MVIVKKWSCSQQRSLCVFITAKEVKKLNLNARFNMKMISVLEQELIITKERKFVKVLLKKKKKLKQNISNQGIGCKVKLLSFFYSFLYRIKNISKFHLK